jgi:Family of unknown function (DUF6184)
MRFSSMIALTSLVFAGACGKAADNTIVEANRELRADALALEACNRYESCNGYGVDSDFQSSADCRTDYKAKALDLWPADSCDRNRISDAKYQVCVDRVKVQACTRSFFDSVSALSECRAAAVCTDPAQ